MTSSEGLRELHAVLVNIEYWARVNLDGKDVNDLRNRLEYIRQQAQDAIRREPLL
jgi:hypothetical protein